MKFLSAASVAAWALFAAGNALSQATPYSATVPQPHLAQARAEADKDNSWLSSPLSSCYPDDGQSSQMIIKDPPPTKAADNLYFVGNGMVAAWVVDTGAGLILIDAMNDQAEVDRYVIAGMRKLGLDPAKLKVIVVSHGHIDHYGGARYLQDLYGARVYQSPIDQALAERAAASPRARAPAPRLDVPVKDGDVLTLGDTTIRMFVTPGHTPGGLSMIVGIKDQARPRKLAYFGGISSKYLSRDDHMAYDASVRRFAQIAAAEGAEGFIANHPSYDGAAHALAHARLKPEAPSPLVVGAAATQRFLTILRECNLNNLDIETAMPEAAARARADRRANPDEAAR